MTLINQKMNVKAKCDKCGADVDLKDVQTPPITVPSSTWPYAQKMYPIKKRFGLATWGSGFVNSRSIYNHVVELDPHLPAPVVGQEYFDVTSDFIVKYFQDQLLKEWQKNGVDAALQPDDFRPFGFQMVGFKNDTSGDPIPITRALSIGKVPSVQDFGQLGATCTGDRTVVNLLWPGGNSGANFNAFSLQDAIDYAKFLVRTTSDYQRFSGKLPTVGGDIDVALVTNHLGFRWIAQKELYRILDH
jgi:hypothetical protein